ncbi:DUF2868 domain-containing protein [Algisphaera agarilytica]|uniref:DUF2868 domain-containing protein n=1 Tax=Algisphaera agarilytica TaxID=1385975 RepID=A0A7X0H431_9BACT|nr:DUF2868 domain-containing protein [Algisphaera agarilytica]MBB6428907.1 hypothetical protein [Algisphaera agarilytica]
MPRLPKPQPGTLLDLATQLHRDEAEPLERLRTRDRGIGKELGFEASQEPLDTPTRARRLTAWLDAIPDSPHRGGDGLRLVGLIAVGIGLLLGYVAAMGLFYYDGSTPVNVVRIIAVFVVLQAVTLGLFGVAALPGRVPGSAWLRDLSPAKLATLVARWLPGETRDTVQQILGRGQAHQRVYHAVQKWQLLAWSQSMALAFNLAAVCGALQLIVFSDLGFGWSTTLQVDAEQMHGLTSALATPWAMAWQDAVPPLALVEATQTYRAENFELGVAAEESAKWWPFLVMAMLVYGVVPRFVTLVFTQWRLRGAVVKAMVHTPGADRVLGRMTAAVVETRASEHEGAASSSAADSMDATPSSQAGCVIRWAEAAYDGQALDAGGGRSLDEDRQTIEAAAAQAPEHPVLIRVKAWEPPVLEFLDFLGDLRRALGDGRSIEVQPIGQGDHAVWKKKLASVGDPWLRMVMDEAGQAEGGTP